MLRKLAVIIITVSGILLTLVAMIYITIRFYPSVLFDERAAYENYEIFTNETIMIDSVLEKSFKKINRSEIAGHKVEIKIFFCDSYWKYSLFSPLKRETFGVSIPVVNHVVISRTDFQRGIVISNRDQNNIRSIESVLTHEIAHRYIEAEFGFWKTRFMPKWKEEGFCEYIAEASSFDIRKGVQIFLADSTDESMSFRYFKYRLYVTYLIDRKGLSFKRIVEQDFDLNELENEIRAEIKKGSFSLPD